ncbi:TIR domain-containing protein [Thalassospira povalilytica]|uniref:TIR domain-containing protein n=1 Tax=Thalassospira povalilytica TaxID=732237 RepID=A0A8I1M8C7_9PROT|nr:TIR domain-containing protein [Thalassospira povalilytica]MBN8196859.1 TIR domain-containing protein [Thalassospira povalilytica]
MHKVFISYHHKKDQWAKDTLTSWAKEHDIFIDASVNTREIDDSLPVDTIRDKIRDDYLKDSSVTIVLVGEETKGRKYVDWEIYSSMYNGKKNKKAGILVIQLPCTKPKHFRAAHKIEKQKVFSDCSKWTTVDSRGEYERRYPYLPDRIVDNLLSKNSRISVTTWERIGDNLINLATMIDAAYEDRGNAQYDLSRKMRTNNSRSVD